MKQFSCSCYSRIGTYQEVNESTYRDCGDVPCSCRNMPHGAKNVNNSLCKSKNQPEIEMGTKPPAVCKSSYDEGEPRCTFLVKSESDQHPQDQLSRENLGVETQRGTRPRHHVYGGNSRQRNLQAETATTRA
ncbi:unnamed protein product, partial [Nesidiocoris tenuis]